MKRLGVLAAVLLLLLLVGCSGAAAAPSPSPSNGGAVSSTQGQIVFSQASYSCAAAYARGAAHVLNMAWSADLSARVGGTEVTSIIAKKVSGGENVVDEAHVAVSNPDANTFSAPGIDVASVCSDPKWGTGDYVTRIIRPSDSVVLAMGTFTLAP
jgi:hypothetical protein